MMKNILVILSLAILSVTGCANEKTAESQETKASEKKAGTIQLTKQGFLNKVMDYESNPETWLFKGDKPCIIDFYADWCAPCRMTSPILEELAVKYHGKIHIYKVDTQQERELAGAFGIRSIPSFLFCPLDGDPVMMSGIAQTKEETKQMFIQRIDQILLGK
jgi:thioredoxin